MTKAELVTLQQEVKDVYINRQVQQYIIQLTGGTRKHDYIFLGVSPRGSIALMKAAKAFAFIHNRNFVLPDDVKYLAPYEIGRASCRERVKMSGREGEWPGE